MSEMEVTESGNDCANDMLLLDRVLLRLGNADSDEQLESCLKRFLPPIILKLSSPHEQVRTKVMELLVHVNKRVKCRAEVQLPVETLLQLYTDANANSFIINFTIIYITMGYPRLPRDQQLKLAPALLEAVENRPVAHQDSILLLVMPLLGEIKETDLNLKEKPKISSLILKFATDVLLLPYRALPNPGESEFQVPPGMSLKTYKRIVDKNQLNPNQLEEMKLSIVNFISKDIFNMNDILLTLIVAAADSRFSVANHANSPLIRVNSSVDWSQASVVAPLYSLYLGTWGGLKIPMEDKKVPACTRLRLKLIQYLNKTTGAAIMFPHCVQVVFSSLFDPNTNSRLRNMALMFLLNVINNGDETQLKKVATVFLQGLLKLIRAEEYAEHHPKALQCLGRLAMKCPGSINNQFSLLEELVKKIPDAVPELKTALRDALLEMSAAFRIVQADKPEPLEVSSEGPSTSQDDKMDVDESSGSKKPRPSPFDEPQALALFALLDHYMHSDESMIRYIATRYAAAVFPPDYIPARYLLLLASGDSQDEISTEALKCLYGTSRPSEIEDVVNNVTKKETTVVNIDEDAAKRDKDKAPEPEFKVPAFKDVVSYIWEQMQKRKKGSNAKHRFVIANQVLQFHPMTYQEILRYLRMCLNRAAALRDCSHHPNATSPLLTRYLCASLLDTELLDHYLAMITSLLAASPDIMPLTCFLDIVGCVPDAMAPKYTSLLPFLQNLFTTSTKEEVRDTAAVIFAIITVNTSNKSAIDKEVSEFVVQGKNNKSLEAQCGYMAAFAHLCERCIALAKRDRFGGKGFRPANWEPYQQAALCLANALASPQTLLVSTSCTAVSLLVRTSALPLPNTTTKQDALVQTDNPFNINKAEAIEDDDVTKFTVADRLFRIVGNAKLPSKVKERALYTLGLMCCGERLSFAKQIVKGFLQMAKDSKEFEIHLQIGESLVLCVEGVNSNENRDLWTELPKEIHGEVNILHDLVLAFVECGRLKQARRILETPGLHTRQKRLENACERYVVEGKSEYLEGLLEATKELSHIDRSNIYYHLLVTYCASNETDKALGLWTMLQEDGEIPSDKFLIHLGEHLKANNREIPFVMPEVPVSMPAKEKETKPIREPQRPKNPTKAEISEKIEKMVKDGDAAKAIDFAIKCIEDGVTPRSNVLKFALKQLSLDGNVEKIQALGKHIDEAKRRDVTYDDKLTQATFNRGAGKQHVDGVLSAVNSANTKEDLEVALRKFPRGVALAAALKDKEMAAQCHKIAVTAASKGHTMPANLLWMEYLLNDLNEEANTLWNSCLAQTETVLFRRLLQEAHTQKKPEIIEKLINVLHTNQSLSPASIGNAYSRLINYYLTENELDKAQATLNKAIEKGISKEHFNKTTLQRLLTTSEAAGKKIEFTI